ncbi:MAG TPA: YciI family protein [Flavipsychrobacter sp.]|nr:YciI family protein [Flavipsychrobacter sp.]
MKIVLLIFTLLSCQNLYAQRSDQAYDSSLAKSLGADDYGMKMYVFVLLKTGSKTIENKTVRDSLFSGHLANINRLADEGKLVVAGPFAKNELSYRGIFILNVKTEEEAKALLETDPAIKENLLHPEIVKWYGSAALPTYLETHKKIEKQHTK